MYRGCLQQWKNWEQPIQWKYCAAGLFYLLLAFILPLFTCLCLSKHGHLIFRSSVPFRSGTWGSEWDSPLVGKKMKCFLRQSPAWTPMWNTEKMPVFLCQICHWPSLYFSVATLLFDTRSCRYAHKDTKTQPFIYYRMDKYTLTVPFGHVPLTRTRLSSGCNAD